MMTIEGLSHIKKMEYNVSDPSASLAEIESYYNTASPFIIKMTGVTGSDDNKFKMMETGVNKSSKDFLD
ncbi:MAG: hypothetical protein ACRCXY_11415 [Fusobacteriaceae bacterium]